MWLEPKTLDIEGRPHGGECAIRRDYVNSTTSTPAPRSCSVTVAARSVTPCVRWAAFETPVHVGDGSRSA
jgi:hypothetical protein